MPGSGRQTARIDRSNCRTCCADRQHRHRCRRRIVQSWFGGRGGDDLETGMALYPGADSLDNTLRWGFIRKVRRHAFDQARPTAAGTAADPGLPAAAMRVCRFTASSLFSWCLQPASPHLLCSASQHSTSCWQIGASKSRFYWYRCSPSSRCTFTAIHTPKTWSYWASGHASSQVQGQAGSVCTAAQGKAAAWARWRVMLDQLPVLPVPDTRGSTSTCLCSALHWLLYQHTPLLLSHTLLRAVTVGMACSFYQPEIVLEVRVQPCSATGCA